MYLISSLKYNIEYKDCIIMSKKLTNMSHIMRKYFDIKVSNLNL